MRNFYLIILRNFYLTFNGFLKSIIIFFVFCIFLVSITIAPLAPTIVAQKISNNISVNIAIFVKISFISFLVIYILSKIKQELKNGIIKNLFINNFTRNQYFFGTYFFWLIIIFISSLISFIFYLMIWQIEGLVLLEPLYVKILFLTFYFFIIPLGSFSIFLFIFYFSFRIGQVSEIITISLFLVNILIFGLILIYSLINSKQTWINYLILITPIYNLIFSIPQDFELFMIDYWWIYLINLFYFLILCALFYQQNIILRYKGLLKSTKF